MKKGIKRLLAFALALSVSIPFAGYQTVFAAKEDTNYYQEESEISFKDVELVMQDGKIKTKNNKQDEKVTKLNTLLEEKPELKNIIKKNLDNNQNLIALKRTKMYVEKKYSNKNGKRVEVDSHILSKEEVDKLSKAEIDQLNQSKKVSSSTNENKNSILPKFATFNPGSGEGYDQVEKYSLWLEIAVFDDVGTSAIDYRVEALADWDYTYGVAGKENPASGEDFLGFYWGGDFDFRNQTCFVDYTIGARANIPLAESDPNKSLVWGFHEDIEDPMIEPSVDEAYASVLLTKPTKGTSTTSINVKYIHTYMAYTPSLVFNNGQFYLSGTTYQWSATATVPGIPY